MADTTSAAAVPVPEAGVAPVAPAEVAPAADAAADVDRPKKAKKSKKDKKPKAEGELSAKELRKLKAQREVCATLRKLKISAYCASRVILAVVHQPNCFFAGGRIGKEKGCCSWR